MLVAALGLREPRRQVAALPSGTPYDLADPYLQVEIVTLASVGQQRGCLVGDGSSLVDTRAVAGPLGAHPLVFDGIDTLTLT